MATTVTFDSTTAARFDATAGWTWDQARAELIELLLAYIAVAPYAGRFSTAPVFQFDTAPARAVRAPLRELQVSHQVTPFQVSTVPVHDRIDTAPPRKGGAA